MHMEFMHSVVQIFSDKNVVRHHHNFVALYPMCWFCGSVVVHGQRVMLLMNQNYINDLECSLYIKCTRCMIWLENDNFYEALPNDILHC